VFNYLFRFQINAAFLTLSIIFKEMMSELSKIQNVFYEKKKKIFFKTKDGLGVHGGIDEHFRKRL
jgi:hypothetical protein